MSGDCAPRIATRVLEWFAYGFYLLLYFTIRIFTCMVCASSDKEVLCISVHPLHLLVFFLPLVIFSIASINLNDVLLYMHCCYNIDKTLINFGKFSFHKFWKYEF